MSNYSDNVNSVRVDFFKPSGKWYTTEAVQWVDWGEKDIHKGLRDSLLAAGIPSRLSGMLAVCLEPYSVYAHPITLIVPRRDAVSLASFERDPGYDALADAHQRGLNVAFDAAKDACASVAANSVTESGAVAARECLRVIAKRCIEVLAAWEER